MIRLKWAGAGRFEIQGAWLLLLALILSAGCGDNSDFPKTYPVTGTVKLKGIALEGATVTFQLMDGKENATGSTDKGGMFSLSLFRPNDGAVAGQYKISISKYDVEPAKSSGSIPGQIASGDLPADYGPPASGSAGTKGATSPTNSLPAKYANGDSSALQATVDAKGKNHFDFDLK